MYSDDEILGVVDQLVRTSVRRGYDDLGVRRTDHTFSDIQEVAASVFLLYSRTPYYLAYLCANGLRGKLADLTLQTTELLSRVAVLRRRSVPVRDLSSLVNAKVALFELESSGTSNIQGAPAWKRVDENLSRFLSRVGSNIKLNGDIVPTPEQARSELSVLVTEYNTQTTELLRIVTLLSSAISDYDKVDLAKYGREVITNARLLLTTTIDELNALDDAGKLAKLRDAVLKVAAMKGVVRDYGTFLGVTPLVLTGTATPFSDATRPALGAVLELDSGPYALTFGTEEYDSTNALRLAADVSDTGIRYEAAATSSNSSPNTVFTRASGSFITDGVVAGDLVDILTGASSGQTRRVQTIAALSLTCNGPTLPSVGACTIRVVRSPNLLYMTSSIIGRIDGQTAGPYSISAGVSDSLQFSIDGAAAVTVPLTAGGTQTAAQVVADIDAVLNVDGYQGEAYFSPLLFDGVVVTAGNTLSVPNPVYGGRFPTTLLVGHEVDIYFGENATTTRTITALLPSPSSCTDIVVDGAVLITNSEDRIRVGSSSRKVRIRPIDPQAAVANKSSIQILRPTDVEKQAAFLLGIYADIKAKSQPTDASSVVSFINGSTNLCTAAVRDDVKIADALIRTEISSNLRLVVYKQRVTASYGSGTNITFTLDEAVAESVVIGDELVLREGLEPGTTGSITAVTDTTVTATMLTALTTASNQLIEIGEAAVLAADDVIEISDGFNQGRYYIDSIYGPSFEATLRTSVPLAKLGFDDPIFATGTVSREGVDLTSKSSWVYSTLETYDPLHVFSTDDGPRQATAQTTYLSLPSVRGVEVGDVLELYTTGSVTPDISATLLSVSEDGVVGIDVAVDATVAYTMAEGRPQAAPSAVLRKVQTYNFDAFKVSLDAWLARTPWRALAAYFVDLNRLVNPLLVNQNPTDADVGAVEQKLLALAGTLTMDLATTASLPTQSSLEAILDTYTVDRVHEVDAMLKTLQERGADRAVDLLLECQFQAFFGVTLENASYGGAFQEAMRNVVQNDLPVNRTRRLESTEGRTTTTIDTDYEYSLDDIDDTVRPDPPVYSGE